MIRSWGENVNKAAYRRSTLEMANMDLTMMLSVCAHNRNVGTMESVHMDRIR